MTRWAPDAAKRGIYVASEASTEVYGYHHYINIKNKGPICSIPVSAPVLSIAVDSQRNLLIPSGGGATKTITVYQGPDMCGSAVASISDPYGQPVDAASNDALTSEIAVADIQAFGNGPGGISVCTVQSGCTVTLTNPNLNQVYGVAMDKSGNCWASGADSSNIARLVYFAGCSGDGVLTTGFQNYSIGGLDIDSQGNLVTMSAGEFAVYVYAGCRPACNLIGGPLQLIGESLYGRINRKGDKMALADIQNGQVDLYGYTPTGLTYLYSFNQGLSQSDGVIGAAFNPRSKE